MSTRARPPRRSEEDSPLEDYSYESAYGLDRDITDEDIEDYLRQGDEEAPKKEGFLNLPTAAGLATVGVGIAYLLQELGLFASGFDFSALLGPWLIGVLIILVGFGVLSWSPDRQRRRAEQRRRAAERQRARQRPPQQPRSTTRESFAERRAGKRPFTKSRTNKKIAGVCGGIGEYFGIDPTIIRIAFVIALIASGTTALPLYLLLAWVMPQPEDADARRSPLEPRDEERVVIIRDR
jgi:phage shock protein C